MTDPREEALPDIGRIRIEDAETGRVVELDTGSAKVRSDFEKRSRGRREAVSNCIRSIGVDFLEFKNGEDWMPALMSFFRNRRQRSG